MLAPFGELEGIAVRELEGTGLELFDLGGGIKFAPAPDTTNGSYYAFKLIAGLYDAEGKRICFFTFDRRNPENMVKLLREGVAKFSAESKPCPVTEGKVGEVLKLAVQTAF